MPTPVSNATLDASTGRITFLLPAGTYPAGTGIVVTQKATGQKISNAAAVTIASSTPTTQTTTPTTVAENPSTQS